MNRSAVGLHTDEYVSPTGFEEPIDRLDDSWSLSWSCVFGWIDAFRLTRWGACWFTLCIFYFMSTHSHFPTHRLPYDMKPAARALPLPPAPTHKRRATPADQETNGKRRFSMTFDGKPFATKILKASPPTEHSWDTEQDIRFSSGSSMQRRAPKPPPYVHTHTHTPFDY
jgi:hypothetical protein